MGYSASVFYVAISQLEPDYVHMQTACESLLARLKDPDVQRDAVFYLRTSKDPRIASSIASSFSVGDLEELGHRGLQLVK